jgi:hypothetical protein
MSKQSLYYFDSSDDENEDKLTNTKYSPKNILSTLAKIKKTYLEPSYILTEVSQSILEQQTIQKKYAEFKSYLSKSIKIPENIGFYHKANKFLGKFLIEDGSVTEIDLHEEVKVFIEDIWKAGDEAKIFLDKKDIFCKNVDKLFQDKQTIFVIDNNQRNLQNKCLEVCAELLGILGANNKNVNELTKGIVKNYTDNTLLLSDILETLQLKEKIVNFQNFENKLNLLKDKTVEDFILKVVTGFTSDLIKASYDNIIRREIPFKLKEEDESDHNYIILPKKEQKIEQQKKFLEKYNEFIIQYFSEDYIKLCYSIDEEGKEYVDKNKFSLFISCVLDDKEGVVKNTNAVLAQYFSEQNELIARELIAYREMFLPVFDSGEDYFVGFKLDHRIIKTKLKTNGILEKQETIHSARTIKNTTVNVQTELTINSSGTREDYKFLPNDQGSYESVAMELSKFKGINIGNNLKNILQGKGLNDCNLSQTLYLYRLADLLFNCEGERNISAFLTNVMFFELVEQGVYQIQDLPNRLPMAMKGAIQASRYTLDMLGGKYGEEGLENYLIKRQYFDYKTTSCKKQSLIGKMQIEKVTQTQQELKEILLHYELTLKDRVVLSDWINKKHDSSIDELISLINTINRIYDVNTKEFNGHNVSYVEEKNRVCVSELKLFLKQEEANLEDSFKEELINNIKILREKPKEEVNPLELQNTAKGIKLYISEIEKLEEKIKSNLDIFSNIMLIDECMRMVNGYNDISKNLRPKLSEESFFTKKLKKIIIKNIKQEEINTFEKLIEYCSQLKDNLPNNFTSILLESVKNGVDNWILKLPQLEINKEFFQVLQVLINEWYKVDLTYLNQELKGSETDIHEKPIDYISSYFGKYTLDALDHILDLRLKDLKLNDIKTLKGIFIDQEDNNISKVLAQISHSFTNSATKTILAPLNLYNKHAVGLIFEKSENNTVQVKYLDSLNKSIPQELTQLIVSNFRCKVNFSEITVGQQKYTNCGVEVIENFILYLTGKRVSQEKAIELHSKLVENALLNIDSSDLYLLFEEVASNYSFTDYLEQINHDNDLSHNFDYEKQLGGDLIFVNLDE